MTAHLPPPLSPGTTPGPDPAAPALDPAPGPAVPLARLSLSPLGTAPHRLDGAWWPRSHDLSRELPSLLAALEQRWPHISRITVSRSLWRTGTDRLLLGERVLRINRSDAAHSMICLVSYGVGRCDLLVIPPGTSVHEGRRLLAAASAVDAEVLRAAGDAVLDAEQIEPAQNEPTRPEEGTTP